MLLIRALLNSIFKQRVPRYHRELCDSLALEQFCMFSSDENDFILHRKKHIRAVVKLKNVIYLHTD